MSDTMDRTRTTPDTRAGDTTLEAVRALVADIAARGEEIERARRLPPALVAQLREAGCFRMLVPSQHGGDQADLLDHLHVVRELARADGSVGWTMMIGGASPSPIRKLPADAFAAIYAQGPDVILAGTFNPTGTATPVDGGYRVTAAGPSRAVASTPTGSSPTASSPTGACRRCA